MDRSDTGGAMDDLPWPPQASRSNSDELRRHARASNCVLDFYGDPASAQLPEFSDGNHHMALGQWLQAFVQQDAVAEIYRHRRLDAARAAQLVMVVNFYVLIYYRLLVRFYYE